MTRCALFLDACFQLQQSTSQYSQASSQLSYVAKVQGNGNLLVGNAYTAMLDLKPGDEFQIKLGQKAIRLIPVGTSDDTEE